MENQEQTLKLKGKVFAIGEERSGISKQGNAWTSREIVIEYENKTYTKKAVFILFNKQAAIKIGDEVTIEFSISAREYNGKYYNSLNIENIGIEYYQQIAKPVVNQVPTESVAQIQQQQAQAREDENMQAKTAAFFGGNPQYMRQEPQKTKDDLPF